MTLASGSHLGPYEILSLIGAGGMGEVYKAKDSRLDRTVAIKVLPSHLSDDAERQERFEREARAVSSLNHPHICTLHDVGDQEGTHYLVMEHIEGESLADRLKKGPLPLDQALRYAVEIADALDKAHRAGVVHRDLKPGNIMLTKSGAKLLDFGLAKLADLPRRSLGEGGSALPTAQKPLTEKGAILGTFQYMAPEQLEGKESDARTDIFAFGALLYEALTGRRAFEGESQASLIGAILHKDPPAPSSLEPLTPKTLDRTVARCLEKDPDERWQSAADLAWELESVAQKGEPSEDMATISRARWSNKVFPWLAAVLGLATLTFALSWYRAISEPKRMVQTSILAPPDSQEAFESGFALSPDGRLLAFSAQDTQGERRLWLRSLDSVEARPFDGTENAVFPFWSPDGSQIGFFAEGRVKKIAVSGGPPQTLCDSPGDLSTGTWNRDNVILLGSYYGPIYKVAAGGGEPEVLTHLDPAGGEIGHSWPMFLPDGRRFLYRTRTQRWEDNKIFISSIDNPQDAQPLLSVIYQGHYAPPGYLLFYQEGALMVRSFDVDRAILQGDSLPIAEDVYGPHGWLALSVAMEGSMAYMSEVHRQRQLVWVDRRGERIEDVAPAGGFWTFGLSRDGRSVLANPGGEDGLWMYEPPRVPERFGSRATGDIDDRISDYLWRWSHCPVFSPDGRRVVFNWGDEQIVEMQADGTGEPKVVAAPIGIQRATDWSPDQQRLSIEHLPPEVGASYDIWLYSLKEEKAEPLIQSDFNERHGRFSPDGKWIAYVSDETGAFEVYVRPLSGSGAARRISSDGGLFPAWRRDGKELFFVRPDKTVMAVPIRAEESVETGSTISLFKIDRRSINMDSAPFDVFPDAERFLVLEESGGVRPLTLVQNWTAELEK